MSISIFISIPIYIYIQIHILIRAFIGHSQTASGSSRAMEIPESPASDMSSSWSSLTAIHTFFIECITFSGVV